MTETEFRNLVRMMRDYQKKYFRSRDQSVLNQCRDLERRVDEALLPPKTPSMFNSEGGAANA